MSFLLLYYWLFRVYRGWTPTQVGIISYTIKRIPITRPGFNGKEEFFFFVARMKICNGIVFGRNQNFKIFQIRLIYGQESSKCWYICLIQIFSFGFTRPKTNSSHVKMDGFFQDESPLDMAYFQGRTCCQFQGGYYHPLLDMFSSVFHLSNFRRGPPWI